ncbi:hypothetical protein T10_6366 [Trichinella papuae]|uniref:Uncharacterized protein n=1 Tax=Trichinella papuae TaxID=268474 RepID=A0A0V1MW20_9BILA|nr:hypothetical protein T10_6366 [Trichinella papuae]
MKNEYIAADELIDDIIQQRRTVAAASFERAHFTTVAPNKRAAAADRQHTGSKLCQRFTPSQLTVGRLLLQPHQPVTTGLCFDACVKKNKNNNNKKIKSKMPTTTTNNDRQHCHVCLFVCFALLCDELSICHFNHSSYN